MTDTNRIDRAARTLLGQFHDKQKYLLDSDTLPVGIAEAYDVQREYQAVLAGAYGPVAGYKIAYTTTAVQQATGLSEPCAGVILANNIRHSPASLESSDYLQVGIECEVAARLGADLPASGAPYDRDGVSKAVDAVMTAFEVVDNRRTEGQERETQLLTTIASNILNAGVVLGEPVTDWRGIHLAGCRGSMTINGGAGWRGDGLRRYGPPAGAAGLAGEHLGGPRHILVRRDGGNHWQHRPAQVVEGGRFGYYIHRRTGRGVPNGRVGTVA